MGDVCGDNRFLIIERAKKDIINRTNIETSKDEIKVLDTFLFRCWQMGWLDKYAEQVEELGFNKLCSSNELQQIEEVNK